MRQGKCVKTKQESFFRPKSELQKGFLWTALIAIILSGILGAMFFLFGEFNDTTIKILSTTAVVGIGAMLMLIFSRFKDRIISSSTIISTSLMVVLFMLNLWRITDLNWGSLWLTVVILAVGNILGLLSYADKNKFLKYSGPLMTAISAFFWLGLTWDWMSYSDGFIRFILIISVISFSLAHISLLNTSKGSRDNLVKIAFWIVVGLISIVTLMLIYLIFNVQGIDLTDTYFRILGFVAILDIAGSITLPILKKVRG